VTGSLALDVVRQRENDFIDLAGLDPGKKARDIQVLRTDFLHWGKFTMKHVVARSPRTAPLDGHNIRDALNYAHRAKIALWISANGTQPIFAQISAARASANGARRLPQRANERLKLLRLAQEKMKRNPLRGTVSYSGQLSQGPLEVIEGIRHRRQKTPGI
jgi:hypothetical protein